MSDPAAHHPAGDRAADHPVRRLAAGYAHGHDVEPQSYAAFVGGYLGAAAGYAALFRRSGRRLPTSVPAGDVALLGTATFKLSRLIARDKVTSFLRFPFTRYQGNAPGPEVNEEPRGEGLRRHVGELATCPFCVSQWAGTALMGLYLVNRPAGRAVASLLSAIALSDALQYADTALHESVGH